MITRMLALIAVSLLPTFALAADPRNTANYNVLFDLASKSNSPIVKGYGAYVQVYSGAGKYFFRYCDNFDGSGTQGRPNPNRIRQKLVPIGVVDPKGYDCKEFTPEEVKAGQPLVKMANRVFFSMRSLNWTPVAGGEILFRFARKIPIFGNPTYKTIQMRGTRKSGGFTHLVEHVMPRGPVRAANSVEITASNSGLGLPNGVSGIVMNAGLPTQYAVDLDGLEGMVRIFGDDARATSFGESIED